MVALEPVVLEDLLVVEDDPVVDAHDMAVAHGMVVGDDGGVALRVVPDVQQDFDRLFGDRQVGDQRTGAGKALVHRDGSTQRPMRVADGVGTALGDSSQQGLSRERPVDPGIGLQAVSGNTTHKVNLDPSSFDARVPLWLAIGLRTPSEHPPAGSSQTQG